MTPTDPSFDLTATEFRRLGHRVVDLMLDAVTAEQSGHVFRAITGAELRKALDTPLPASGTPMDEIMQVWRDAVLPYCRRNGHPRFFGYVCTSADPFGMFADAMASALNQPVTAWRSTPGAATVERLAVKWLDDLVRFGGDGSGLLVSGGSTANLHGLACAVSQAENALGPGHRHRMTVYMTSEAHVSLAKAARLLGLHPDHVRRVASDERRRMVPDALDQALAVDRASGLTPCAVCTSAGTANTGAIDPLVAIAEICREHGVWHHIDGSYGAPAVLCDSYEWMAEAFSRADSLSLDPHKWLFAPCDAGCILVRREDMLRSAFAQFSEYTEVTQTDPIERYAFFDHGIEMSRRFRGLKVWTILKARGTDSIRAAIERDIRLRGRLDAAIAAHPNLESLGSELSIACFRYLPDDGAPVERANAINRRIVETLVAEGDGYMSPTTLDGAYALRVCIVNFRTQETDIDWLVERIVAIGSATS